VSGMVVLLLLEVVLEIGTGSSRGTSLVINPSYLDVMPFVDSVSIRERCGSWKSDCGADGV